MKTSTPVLLEAPEALQAAAAHCMLLESTAREDGPNCLLSLGDCCLDVVQCPHEKPPVTSTPVVFYCFSLLTEMVIIACHHRKA